MADRLFQLDSGRGVSISAAGDPLAPRLVFLCLPTGAAGAFDPDPLVSDTWGVHLMMVDRPGYASSAPLADDEAPAIEVFADDLAEYVRRSEHTAEEVTRADFGSVGVVGWGFGGLVALSLAARHPDLVDRVAVVGVPAPHRSRLRSPDDAALETRKPKASVAATAADLSDYPWQRLDALGIGPDDPAIETTGLRSRLERALGEAATQGPLGVATDLVAGGDRSWTAELSQVTASVKIFSGGRDPLADSADGDWFAKRIDGSETVGLPDAGHLALVSAWPEILAHVAPDGGHRAEPPQPE